MTLNRSAVLELSDDTRPGRRRRPDAHGPALDAAPTRGSRAHRDKIASTASGDLTVEIPRTSAVE